MDKCCFLAESLAATDRRRPAVPPLRSGLFAQLVCAEQHQREADQHRSEKKTNYDEHDARRLAILMRRRMRRMNPVMMRPEKPPK